MISMEIDCGLEESFVVGFASKAHRPVIYRVWVPHGKYEPNASVDVVKAAYDGEVIRVKGVTSRMLHKGRGMSTIPVYGVFRDLRSAHEYSNRLREVVQKKTGANWSLLCSDPSTVTKKMWREMTRGLWTVDVPEWH